MYVTVGKQDVRMRLKTLYWLLLRLQQKLQQRNLSVWDPLRQGLPWARWPQTCSLTFDRRGSACLGLWKGRQEMRDVQPKLGALYRHGGSLYVLYVLYVL